jgi:hypothetical protein
MNTRMLDPNTSHEAEKSVTGLALSYRVILGALRDYGPMNDESLIKVWRKTQTKTASDSGIRSRRSELAATGLVIDSGERQRMDSGRMSIVWSIA